MVDYALLFDNSEGNHELIAEKNLNEKITVWNEVKFNELKNKYDSRK